MMTQKHELPDVSKSETSQFKAPLKWVGMESIHLPLKVRFSGMDYAIQTQVAVSVNLPSDTTKGIHMSRLYLLIKKFADDKVLSPVTIEGLLNEIIHTHDDCGSTAAKMSFSFNLLLNQKALITEGLNGWQNYPIEFQASLENGKLSLSNKFQVTYSSTCPCSAALARDLMQTQFESDFKGNSTIKFSDAIEWIKKSGTLATPHGQRSHGIVSTQFASGTHEIPLLEMIEKTEKALGTPVQNAVKRADEQEFARLNGANLMFVEDAARKIRAAFLKQPGCKKIDITVKHFESLHPHDVIAEASIDF